MSRRLMLGILFAAVVVSTAVLQYRQVARLAGRQDAPVSLKPGDSAPELSIERPDGSILALADLRDRVVIVSFWASWCLPCRAEMPELVRFAEDWNATPGRGHDAVYVAVNVGEQAHEIRSFLRDSFYREVVFGLDPEGEAAARWMATALPATFVIGPEGTVLDVIRGYDPGLRYRLSGILRKYGAEA